MSRKGGRIGGCGHGREGAGRVAVRRPLGRARGVRPFRGQCVPRARPGALRDRADRHCAVRDLGHLPGSRRRIPRRRSRERTARRSRSRRLGAAHRHAGERGGAA